MIIEEKYLWKKFYSNVILMIKYFFARIFIGLILWKINIYVV